MTGDRPPVRVSGSVELHLDQVAERLASLITAGVVAGLAERGLGIVADGDRSGYAFDPDLDHHAPPTYGEVTE